MCVRTKSSYGCGHSYKEDQSCHRQSCAGLERYLLENEGDCRKCKRDGDVVARGREGQGRYAQGLSKQGQKGAPRMPCSPVSSHGQPSPGRPTSPWAPSQIGDTNRRSRIRRQADEAWEEEHAQRQEDLDYRSAADWTGDTRPGPPQSPHSQTHQSRRRQDHNVIIQEELRIIQDSERARNRRRRDRQPSYDSFESLGGSYCSCGSAPYGHSHGTGRRSDGSGASHRGPTYDSGFGRSGQHTSPYNLYNTESYFRGLGQGFGDLVRDSGKRWAKW